MAKLEHDKDACIGCGACVAIHPEGWEMADDGKATILDGKEKENNWEEKEISEEFEQHKEAAESCPVTCIHITDDDGNKII